MRDYQTINVDTYNSDGIVLLLWTLTVSNRNRHIEPTYKTFQIALPDNTWISRYTNKTCLTVLPDNIWISGNTYKTFLAVLSNP
jgi:hypothetical protein